MIMRPLRMPVHCFFAVIILVVTLVFDNWGHQVLASRCGCYKHFHYFVFAYFIRNNGPSLLYRSPPPAPQSACAEMIFKAVSYEARATAAPAQILKKSVLPVYLRSGVTVERGTFQNFSTEGHAKRLHIFSKS